MNIIEFENEKYPAFQAQGNASQFAISYAKHFCKGIGYDVGFCKEKWKYPGAIGIDLDDSWTVLTQFNSGSLNIEDKYVWQEIGEDVYDKLIGRYLQSTNWNIRYVKFSGDQQEKTEEYSVILNNDGTLNQVRHKIPENRFLPTLNEDEARILARKYIFNKFYLNVSEVEELSYQPSELPNRIDWLFTFKDINN